MEHSGPSTDKGTILVVDDTLTNLQVLVLLLTGQGYAVHTATDGNLALKFAEATPPDLILLDILMPGMDGFEVCACLKGSVRTRDIPVIFLSVADQTPDKIKAFSSGGVDYIIKPFQAEEVLARVQTHMALHLAERQLAAQNELLQQKIVEHQQAAEALRLSETRSRQALEQTQIALTETQALYHVTQALIGFESLRDLLQTIVDSVAEALPANRVSLSTFDMEARQLTHFVKGGIGVKDIVDVSFDELRDGLVGWVLREGQPALSPKAQPDPRESPEVQQRRVETNCGAIIAVPLRYRNKTLGVMVAINCPDEREFTQQDVALMMAMAGQAAIAIENARLFNALQSANAELEQRVAARTAELVEANVSLSEEVAVRKRAEEALRHLNQAFRALSSCNQALLRATEEADLLHDVCQIIKDECGYPLVWIGFAESDATKAVRPVVYAGFEAGYLETLNLTWADTERGRGPTGTAIRTRQPVINRDVLTNSEYAPWRDETARRGIASSAAFPLLIQERALGVLNVYATTPNAFDPEAVDLLMELASDLAYGIDTLRMQAERRRAEQALQASEQRYRLLVERMNDGLSVIDLERRFTFVNQKMGDILGYSPDELIGQSLEAFLDVPNRTVLDEQFARRRRGERSVYELDWTGKAGRQISTLVSGSPLMDENGVFGGSFAVITDITDRKRAEAALSQSEAAEREQRILAETLRETMAALTSTLDLDTVMRLILDKVTHVVPYEKASIALFDDDGSARIAYWRNFPPEAETFFDSYRFLVDQSAFRQIWLTGKPVLVADTALASDWVSLPVTRDTRSYLGAPIQIHGVSFGAINLDSMSPGFFTDKQAGWLQVFADQAAIAVENAHLYAALQRYATDLEQRVNERTKELDQQRLHLQAILEGMAEGVAYVNVTTEQTRYVNRAFTELTGWYPEEVIDRPVSAYKGGLVVPDEYDQLAETIRATIRQKNTWRGTLQVRRKDGFLLELGLTASVVPDADGQPTGVVVLARDIGPEKALQAQKDRFIASASHELRTPITNLKLRLYLARRQPEKTQEHLAIVENTADYMANLVEALLEVSRFERGIISLQRKTVPLQDILWAAIVECQLQAERKNIQVASDLQAEPLMVYVDPIRIRQVADNLIMNAINYTPEGGQVQIRAFAEPSADVAWAVFRIQDTGIGIAPEDIRRLFEPFYRAASSTGKGMGLGLTITKDIIDLHGGQITVESQVGQGSIFSVRLPLERLLVF